MPLSHEVPYHGLWKQLIALREINKSVAESVAAVKLACSQGCGKGHIVECDECYETILTKMKRRYSETQALEAFSSSPQFIGEIDEIYWDAIENRTDLSTVESLIELAKQKWYIRAVGLSKIGRVYEVEAGHMPAPPHDGPDDEALGMEMVVDAVLDKVADRTIDLDDFMTKFQTVKDEPETKILYGDVFFADENGDVPQKRQMYLEMLRSNTTIDRVMDAIIEDLKENIAMENQMEKVRQRLDELRRAEKAYKPKEPSASKKPNVRPRGRSYNMPACAMCATSMGNGANSYPCLVCLTYNMVGFTGMRQVYCSKECRDRGHEAHIEQAHICDATSCVLTRGGDISPEPNSQSQICRECLVDLGKKTVYCSERCAGLDFQLHREHVHLPGRRRLGKAVLADEEYLRYDTGWPRKYHADDISRFLWTAREALDKVLKGATRKAMDWRLSTRSK